MTEPNVPAAIGEFVDATNAADSERFVAAFTEDAYLNDWGREFHGHDGIRSWDRSDNIGRQSHFELVSIEPAGERGAWTVVLTVTGNGFNGTGPMRMTVRGDKLASVVISPTH